MDLAIIWVIAGGLLEPVWVVALKKLDEERNLKWASATVFFALLSPVLMGIGMKTMSVGAAYAIWTGIGAVCTMIVGYYLYKEKVDAMKMVFVGMILAGVVGLQLATGGV